MEKIIWDIADPSLYTREHMGGKGLNLLRLTRFSRENGLFRVPPFFILPTDMYLVNTSEESSAESIMDFREHSEIKAAFSKLNKPIIVRSSSPDEDGEEASFAGMFMSIPDQTDYRQFISSCGKIKDSIYEDKVTDYARRRGIEPSYEMAFIVQEQVVNPSLKGIIQLESDKIILEETNKSGKSKNIERDYGFLDEFCPLRSMEPLDYIAEGHYYILMNLARDAKKAMGLEGLVQVEFCFSPEKRPDFVQIRKIPETSSPTEQLNLQIPGNVPMLESKICNGVAGELILPAYVTVSPFGIQTILVSSGQGSYIGVGREDDERSEEFEQNTKLAKNHDFIAIRDLKSMQRYNKEEAFRGYDGVWERGNTLFKDYILVCDRLDDSCDGMNALTTNKRAIITYGEENRTSHAMTVTRELGIMCMGIEEDMYDINRFLYQVETGDLIHMKSDGKKAVAYIERRRDKDPYIQS